MARILIVEDESHIADGLEFNLEAEGFETVIARTGREAVELLTDATSEFDLVILDVMLPEMSGFEVARRTRASGNFVAILMLTAKDETADVVRGLEEGADDYLTKPFRLDELLARTKGLLRRRRWDGVEPDEGGPREIEFGDVRLLFDRFELVTPRGTVSLTAREMGLLRALVDREGEAVTRGELLEEVWGLKPDTRTRVIDSFIVRLRRYIEADPAKPRHILSVRGHGYRFER
jgi:two-component system alkaline phosphatase synthesis response regulator PhoP